jgi:hypothetical protein
MPLSALHEHLGHQESSNALQRLVAGWVIHEVVSHRKSGHDLTSCIKLSKRSKQQGNGKCKGSGQGKFGKSKGRANSW